MRIQSNTVVKLASFISFFIFSACNKNVTIDSRDVALKDPSGSLSFDPAAKPNIILFIADDYGYELPNFTGGDSYSTPTLNYLAANGIQFYQAYSHPDGFPSRLATYTGKYNFRNYIRWGYLPPTEKTIANMLHDNAGYKTCFVGKWQNDGGDTTAHRAGFDTYSMFLPFSFSDQRIGRYKNPLIYQNANFLPSSQTDGKYSEDFFSDYLCNFIDSNKTKPFFAVYSNNVVASDFSPTPDDPDFASWNPDNPEDKKYFPGMVAYQDKMMNKVLQKLRANGIENNTCIIFIGDNATSKKINSTFNGGPRNGGKNLTNKRGTQTPLVVYWPARILPGQRKSTLIDFTDFLPTLADIAGIPKPSNYGILDGTSFYDNMVGNRIVKDRTWVFAHWDNSPTDDKVPVRYVNDAFYKLYDTLQNSNFFNVKKDVEEKTPLKDNDLTPAEVLIKANFKAVLATMHN